jgi:hypothetical protein
MSAVLLATWVIVSCVLAQTPISTNDSPTEAYKRLYAAVKSRDTDAIKKEMSQKTIEFGLMAAGRNKTPVNKVYENGFTATTFGSALPNMRDERINGDLGAVEVWNSKESKWEDLPFVREDGRWKLAVGELFDGTSRSPRSGSDLPEKGTGNSAGTVAMTATGPPAKPKPKGLYTISAIKIVPFDEILGEFREPVDPEQWFGNDLSMSLFVTIELSGDPGGYVPKRNVQITVTEGKKIKLSRIAYPGVFSEQGKYYVPVWLYGSMCDPVKITASVTGQKTRSSLSRTVNFHCGE